MAEQKVDVLIIGSGHSGGMAAKILTEKGISCVMLNAGPFVNFEKDRELKSAYQLPYRGFDKPGRLEHVWQSNEFNANQWVDEKEIPYTYDQTAPYNWVRVRLFGGRSLFWSRQSFRFSDYEFKVKDHDGVGDNWPISLADLAPYYTRVESIFHVRGHTDGLPQYPDGNFIEDDSPWSGSMQRFVAAGKKLGVPVTKARSSLGVDGLASSINLLIPDAVATGKLTAIPNAVVRQITVDKSTGLANGVLFVDRHSKREMSIKARVVVLAAGCLESTRLLLNSNIANSSGVLGHYLTDNTYGAGITCSVPEGRDGKSTAALMGGGALVPRFRNINSRSKNFAGGYALNVYGGGGAMDPRNFAEYGDGLQKKLDSYRGSGFSTGMMGQVISRYENYAAIDKTKVDAWGIPVLHINHKYTDNEYNMAKDAADTSAEMAEAAGFEVLVNNPVPNPPGYSIHEIGSVRMGDSPKTSVLNKFNQSHDIKNLFVVDGSSFTGGGWQNPTITISTLSMRASEYLADQMRQGNI
jgi:choline dehydrogenase-like flavoprotein